jgi:CheY-like chemotaxis protein
MNAILGYAQLLHRDATLRDGQREAMQTILSSGNHLLAVIDDILDLSKIEAGHVQVLAEDFDLARLAAETVAMFRHRCEQKGIDLRLDNQAAGPSAVRGDEGKLRQVLINLLGNAVKFTDAGSVTLRWARVGDQLFRFEIADTGPGIAVEAQASVFDAFQQASAGIRRGGTGLGLAICRQYVELMGGKLELASSPGAGSVFAVTLPLTAAEKADVASFGGDLGWRLPAAMRSRGVRALVVDDVSENRAVLAEILSAAGCAVEQAASADEAMVRMEAGLPDVAFIDIMMPGTDGIELSGRILERFGQGAVCLIATTASAFAHQQRRYLAAGFDEVMAKPIRCERVYECLGRLFGEEAAAAAELEVESASVGDEMVLSVPGELRMRLAAAAELCSITDVKRCLLEIESSGAASVGLMRRLKKLVQAYDLPAVQRMAAGATDAIEVGS